MLFSSLRIWAWTCFCRLCAQEERLRWSSTRSSQIWTGTACWGRKQSLFLSWSPRTTPVTLTVSFRVQYRCLWSQSTVWTVFVSFSPFWSVPPCGLGGGRRHQWRWARGAPAVLFLLASLQQGTDKTPRPLLSWPGKCGAPPLMWAFCSGLQQYGASVFAWGEEDSSSHQTQP